MNYSALLSANPSLLADTMSLSERVAYGAQVMIIGMLTVFAVLTLLWGILIIFKYFAHDLPAKKEKTNATVPSPIQAIPVEEIPLASNDDDTQLIAVITAAISAYTANTSSAALPFRVVSYKRVGKAAGWNGSENNETI